MQDKPAEILSEIVFLLCSNPAKPPCLTQNQSQSPEGGIEAAEPSVCPSSSLSESWARCSVCGFMPKAFSADQITRVPEAETLRLKCSSFRVSGSPALLLSCWGAPLTSGPDSEAGASCHSETKPHPYQLRVVLLPCLSFTYYLKRIFQSAPTGPGTE